MTNIRPALLEQSFADIERRIEYIYSETKSVQIDVCDGVYTKLRTWPYVGEKSKFQTLVSGAEGLPHWDALDYEVDLMVTQPERLLQHYVSAGFACAVIHFASHHSMRECREAVGDTMLLGLALTVNDDPESAAGDIAIADYVQVMGIERPGTQGAEFTPKSIQLIETLRKEYPDLELQVDGGVNKENAQSLIAAGATTLVAGSAIFRSGNPLVALRALQSI